MSRIKKVMMSWRTVLLIVFILLALAAINPKPWNEGLSIKGVTKNSSAAIAGIRDPGDMRPLARERVLAVNNT